MKFYFCTFLKLLFSWEAKWLAATDRFERHKVKFDSLPTPGTNFNNSLCYYLVFSNIKANSHVVRMTDLLNMTMTDYPTTIHNCIDKRKLRKFLFWVYFLRRIFVKDQSMFSIFTEEDKPVSDCWTSFICSYEGCFWKLYKYIQAIFTHFFN